MKGYAVSAIASELKMKLTFFFDIRQMFFSKLEPNIRFLRLQSHETLLSHLMSSTDYFINIYLISFISSCFDLRDNLVYGIINPTHG